MPFEKRDHAYQVYGFAPGERHLSHIAGRNKRSDAAKAANQAISRGYARVEIRCVSFDRASSSFRRSRKRVGKDGR
jgi:hypothetical protein